MFEHDSVVECSLKGLLVGNFAAWRHKNRKSKSARNFGIGVEEYVYKIYYYNFTHLQYL